MVLMSDESGMRDERRLPPRSVDGGMLAVLDTASPPLVEDRTSPESNDWFYKNMRNINKQTNILLIFQQLFKYKVAKTTKA